MPAVDVLVGDTGETTDDGSASPILRMRGGPTGGRRGLADTAGGTDAHADNVTAIASVVNWTKTAGSDVNDVEHDTTGALTQHRTGQLCL